MARKYNFNPGPATLPLEVLEEIQAELLEYGNTGMSILELSHRSAPYEKINAETESDIKELLSLGDDYRVLFMGGGCTQQFSLVPMNLLEKDKVADHVVTGVFAQKAMEAGAKIGAVKAAIDLKNEHYKRVPSPKELKYSDNQAYLHITTNNTIFGTAWQKYPDFGDVCLVADMSSDFLSQPFDATKFSMIYGGVQKNLGPAGAAFVIIKKTLLEKCLDSTPDIFSYKITAKENSLFNTPPVFVVYTVGKIVKWLKKHGGLEACGRRNYKKADMIYSIIDKYNEFYFGHAEKDSRSIMNITFRLPNEELEKRFAEEAKENGLLNVKGHRMVGGMRISVYNYMPLDGVEKMAQFMEDFYKKHK